METRPILIAGAGAIGSVIGAMLRRAEHPVAMLGRARHLEAIARGGLHVSGLFGEHHARGFAALVSDPADLSGRFDLILLTVKAYDTGPLAERLVPMLEPGGIIVSMQNGIGNLDVLVKLFGPARVIGARVMLGAEIEAPGRVRATVFGQPLALGPSPGLQPRDSAALLERAREIAAILSAAGLPTEAHRDVQPLLWSKLFYNAALNPLGALLRLHYGALAADPELRAIMDDVIEEAFAVAAAMRIAVPFGSADEYRDVFYSKLVPATFNHRPTMLYDLERRGRTDIGEMNGKVAELADQLGLRADTNRFLTRLIRARERMWRGESENHEK